MWTVTLARWSVVRVFVASGSDQPNGVRHRSWSVPLLRIGANPVMLQMTLCRFINLLCFQKSGLCLNETSNDEDEIEFSLTETRCVIWRTHILWQSRHCELQSVEQITDDKLTPYVFEEVEEEEAGDHDRQSKPPAEFSSALEDVQSART